MSNPVDAIGAVATATGKAIDLATTREVRNNTPEMQERERAQTRADVEREATKAVAEGDLDAIRRQAAE